MKPVIDISYWQKPQIINYDRLATAIAGVIIRASYGSRKDAHFEKHYSEFIRRGVPVGVYSFLTEYMPVNEQVLAYREACAGKTFSLGHWADVEAEAGAELLTLPTVRKWLSQADAALGVKHGIYTSRWMWQRCTGGSADFGDRPLWVAHYGVSVPLLPAGWRSYRFHQYSSDVIHAGYPYRLDTNRFNGSDDDFAKLISGEAENEDPVVLWRGEVNASLGLNVRSARDYTKANVTRALPFRTEVRVYEEKNGWARIHPRKQQWVVSRFLDVIKEGEPEKPSPIGIGGVLDVMPICQRDYPQKLGWSNTTIAGYGCLLTCATMLVNYQLGMSITPPEMNEIIKGVNGFVNGNLFVFASLWNAFPNRIGSDKFIRTPYTPAPLSEIDAVLLQGRPVIVETRLNHVSQHWVLIIGKKDGAYIMADPWTGKIGSFNAVYGDPARWIYSIVSYKTL